MWNVVLVAIAITLAILGYRMFREKKLVTANAMGLGLIIVAALFVPARLESTTLPGVRPPTTPLAIPSTTAPPIRITHYWLRPLKQIADRRAGFRFATSRASDMDSHVLFNSNSDVLRYLPRAAVALGLVVVNAGALFRIRYVFWMLMIVLAAGYLTVLRTNFTKS